MTYGQKRGHRADAASWSTDAAGRVSSHNPQGLDVDGYVAPLDGEPPIAKSKGWGNLTFLYRPSGGGN